MKFFLSLLLLAGCSTRRATLEEYNKLKDEISPKSLSCTEYVRTLDKSLLEKDDKYFFVKDEKKALPIIKSFDPEQLAIEENKKHAKFSMTKCFNENTTPEPIILCVYNFSAYNFIQALTNAVGDYKWSKATKEVARSKIDEYIAAMAKKETSMLDKSMAVSVLQDLIAKKLISQKYEAQIADLTRQRDVIHEDLMTNLKGDKGGCQTWSRAYERESKAAKDLGKKLTETLNAISVP